MNGLREKVAARFGPGGIGRQISWLLMNSGVEAGTMTVAAFLTARWFGPAALGQLGILLAGVQLISMIADGFYGTIIKFVSEARTRTLGYVAGLGWRLIWITVLILFFCSLVLGVFAETFFSAQLSVVWISLAVIVAGVRGWRTAYDGAYRGFQEFRIPAIAGMVCVSATAAGIILLSVQGYRVGGYLAVLAAGTGINCLWLTFAYKKKYLAQSQAGDYDYKSSQFLRYSLPLALRGASGFLFLKVNIWIIGWLATEVDAGQFRLTDQFLTIPALILSAVLSAVAPRVAESKLRGNDALANLMSKVYGLMLALTVPMALCFWFNEPVLNWLFPAYTEAGRMLVMFAPAMAVQGLGYAASIILVQGGQPGAAFGITLISGIANVLAAWVGFKLGGVMGLTLGTAGVHIVTHIATVIIAHRLFKLPFRIRFH